MIRRRIGIPGLIAAAAFFVTACGQDSQLAPDIHHEPVVVYAAFEDDAPLREMFARYSEDTGVLVIVRRGTSLTIVDDIIENKISPPADVLMTRSVTGIWRAAEKGALRPIASTVLGVKSPAWSRDPDDLWAGTGFRTAVIVYDAATVNSDSLGSYEALAEPQFKGMLCLSSSAESINRTVIAMLIDGLGVRQAELAVRGWMKNLVQPVYESEGVLLQAIGSGHCEIGIASSSAAAAYDLATYSPAATFVDVDGVGIGRHARNPDGALALVEWLFAELPGSHFNSIDAAGQKNVGLVAWHFEEAVKLVERAQYR